MKNKKDFKKEKIGSYSYFNPKLEVKNSLIDGKGVFAKKSIKKGEVINIFTGMIVSKKEYQDLFKSLGKIVHDYAIKIEDNFYILSSLDENEFLEEDFINHSCSPSAGFDGQIIIKTMRNIKKGEEITYDYIMTDSDTDDNFKCNCGVKNCRKIITGNDWKKPELQKKYKGYFSCYIQKKIDKFKKKN